MTRGLTRDQIGVTEEMILAYGERIWELSCNLQVRYGDPVRELDWRQIEAQSAGRGMADVEIAEEIGLTRDQVLYIRVVLERRKFRRDRYHRLYDLGGGRRFRMERFTPHEQRPGYSPEAMEIRRTLDFDPRKTRDYLSAGYWNAETVPALLRRWAAERPDHPALLSTGGTLTYAQTHDRVLRLANSLLALGINKGDVVAAQLPNGADFVLSYLAITMMGGVFCPLHATWRNDELEALLRRASARAVICAEADDDYDAPNVILDFAGDVRLLEHVIIAGEDAPEDALALPDLFDDSDPLPIEAPPVATDPALLCFTSGTTGAAKALVHNYHTMLSNSRVMAPLYDLGPEDIVFSALPFTYAVGVGTINLTLREGASIAAFPEPPPQVLVQLVETHKPSVLFLSPSLAAAARAAECLEGHDLSSVRKATMWGTACPPDLACRLDEALPNGTVAQMWGATECFVALHTPFGATAEERHGSVGAPLDGFTARIATPSDTPLPAGEEGELEISGCSLFANYVGGGRAEREAFSSDHWFRTGDVALTDENGNVVIVGRTGDTVQRDGAASAGS